MNYIFKKSLGFLMVLMLIFASCTQNEAISPVKKHIEEAVFASGYLEQENNYTVSAKVEGIIASLPVKEGDVVSQHDLIAIIENDVQDNQVQDALAVYNDAVTNASSNSPQLQHLQTQIEQAQQQLEFDQENYVRYKDLWEKKSVSKLEFERAELQYQASESNLIALQKNYAEVQNSLRLSVERSLTQLNTQKSMLNDYRMITHESGKVINVFKKQGELARRGEAIAKIGSGTYVIKLFVSEEDITQIQVNHPVAVNLNTYPGETFPAKVTHIYPGFDEIEQSYIVEAQFEQLPERMFSGTQLQANIETGRRKNVLVVPTEYVSKGNVVILKNGEEKQIETGSKNSVWTEVISGITEEDLIIKSIN